MYVYNTTASRHVSYPIPRARSSYAGKETGVSYVIVYYLSLNVSGRT